MSLRDTDTQPPLPSPLLRQFCCRCDAMLGRQSTYIGDVGPLCEVCADHQAEENYRREESERRHRKTWAAWLWSLLRGW